MIGETPRAIAPWSSGSFWIALMPACRASSNVHLVLDNYGTHKTPLIWRWLAKRPRFHVHFTPTYGSWLNLVERWFAELTTKQRSEEHTSELQSRQYLVCRLLLEKKKINTTRLVPH